MLNFMLSTCRLLLVFQQACTKTRNNEMKRPKQNHRNDQNNPRNKQNNWNERNHRINQHETAEMSNIVSK